MRAPMPKQVVGLLAQAFWMTAPLTAGEAPESKLIVQFEGGTVSENVTTILRELVATEVVETATFALEPGETVCDVYSEKAGLPGSCSEAVVDLAAALNPNVDFDKPLPVGLGLEMPAVELTPYEYSVRLDEQEVAADRKRADDYRTHWKDQIVREEAPRDGMTRLVFNGYRLDVSLRDDEHLSQIYPRLRLLQSPNVIVTPVSRKPLPRKLYAHLEQFWEACLRDEPLTVGTASLGELIGMSPGACEVSCAGRECAGIVVVDTGIAAHPDLNRSLTQTDPGTAYKASCLSVFDEDRHHGTHLAGIAGASGGTGRLAGVNPGVHIQPVLYAGNPNGDAGVASEIDRHEEDIFLFASRWEGRSCRNRAHGSLIAKRICDVRPMWIAAAGDEDGDGVGEEITTAYRYGPMNLGTECNVVIVTACSPCEGITARIPEKYNWSSDDMVHVAAPGGPVPSTATDSQYALAEGTSQAAAFVAGLASMMQNCYPHDYIRPHLIKTRLQATSTPLPPTTEERTDGGLATGIVDAGLALRNPDTDWLKKHGQAWESVRIRQWLVPRLRVADPVDPQRSWPEIRTQITNSGRPSGNLLRLKYFPPQGEIQEDLWTVYSRTAWAGGGGPRGKVARSGPGLLDNPDEPILELCPREGATTGEMLSLRQIDEVLVDLSPQDCP